jgi:hypothetical protein
VKGPCIRTNEPSGSDRLVIYREALWSVELLVNCRITNELLVEKNMEFDLPMSFLRIFLEEVSKTT